MTSKHNLYYYRRARACVCVCKIGQISARTLSFRHQTSRKKISHCNFPIPTFGPLFSFHCPLFFTKNNNLECRDVLKTVTVMCVCVCANFDRFLPVRSQFDSNQHVNYVRIATFQSANFGPLLFAFYCPLFFTKTK